MAYRHRLRAGLNKILGLAGLELRSRPGDFRQRVREAIPEIDEDDLSLLERCRPFTMTGPLRQWALVQALRYVDASDIDGAIVECGVWRGGNLLIALAMGARSGRARAVWGFDTFAGMTEPGEHDRSAGGTHARAKFEETRSADGSDWCYASQSEVRANLGQLATAADLHLVEGPVESTLREQTLPDAIALLRLDTDWYESTRTELDVLYPRLVPGGVLIVDDYGHWQGAKRAVDEYFHGQSLLWHRVDYTCRLALKPELGPA